MADVRITALDACARWSLRLPPVSAAEIGDLAGFRLDLPVNRGARAGERLSARLGPDEWFLCAPPEAAPRFDALEGRHHSLVDVGHRYTAFTVEGTRAPVLLAAGCPLDLDPAIFLAGTATRTLMGKAEMILWRLAEAPSFRLECARTYAPYVRAFLHEAAREWE